MAKTNISEAASWLRTWQQGAADHGSPEDDQLVNLVGLVDARIKNAYDAVLRKLARQGETLSSIRNRASGILTVAALITSFVTGLGFLKTGLPAGPTFPNWAKWTLFSVLLLMIFLHLAITWPVTRTFGANPEAALYYGEVPPEGTIRISLVEDLIKLANENEKWNELCSRFYQGQSLALVAEVIIIIVATLRG